MHSNMKMEQFNHAYIYALAAQAGLNCSKPFVDDDSIDLEIFARNFSGGMLRNPKIELQLKCVSQPVISGGAIKYPLPVKNYNDLRGDNVVVPRYLLILLVPEQSDDWLLHHDEHISLHHCCYWASIRTAPPTTNSATVTIDIPLSQRLTTTQLLKLVHLAGNEVAL